MIRTALVTAALAALAAVAPPAWAQQSGGNDSLVPRLVAPPSTTQPPPGFSLSANQARRIADRIGAVRARFRDPGSARAKVFISGPRRWEVDYYAGPRNVVQVDVDGRTGRVLQVYSGAQAESYLARGHFGGAVDSPWVWALLSLLFVAPFFDRRRPFRLLHLDLLVLLSFGLSQLFFTRGDVATSVPLVYPVLAYLLVRMLVAGFRPRADRGPLVPHLPTAVLAVALVALVGGRIWLNVAHSRVIDVGYASVVGADRIQHREQLYVNNDIHGDTYGPVNYIAYVPFEIAFPTTGRWDDVPAAHAAAIAFDLLTMLALLLVGMRLRRGPPGRRLGLALAFAWAAYPYTALALAVNTNDGLVSMLLAFALLAAASPALRGALIGLAAAAKFAPAALVPLFMRMGKEGWRHSLAFVLVALAVVGLSIGLYLPDGGLREFYDTTIGYQFGRWSPFSPWGQHPGLEWLKTVLVVGGAGLALALAVVPRRREGAQVAALGAAVLIATSLSATHWFYLYIMWFAPYLLVALLAEHGTERLEERDLHSAA